MSCPTIVLPGTQALEALSQHRARFAQSRQYPFLVGDHEELEQLKTVAEINEQDFATIVAASAELDIADWIDERKKDAEQYGIVSFEAEGEWPGHIQDKGSVTLHKNILTGKEKPEVHLGLANIEEPWQLPAFMKFGAWNECPRPEVHCAFHRKWYQEYGAEIIGMSHETIECTVAKPPTDKETALKLAWEQYWYCPDIVEQGCGSVALLAATIMKSDYWFFWWD